MKISLMFFKEERTWMTIVEAAKHHDIHDQDYAFGIRVYTHLYIFYMCIVLVFVAPNVDLFHGHTCHLTAPSPQVLGAKATRPPDNVESMIFLGREDDASVSVLPKPQTQKRLERSWRDLDFEVPSI